MSLGWNLHVLGNGMIDIEIDDSPHIRWCCWWRSCHYFFLLLLLHKWFCSKEITTNFLSPNWKIFLSEILVQKHVFPWIKYTYTICKTLYFFVRYKNSKRSWNDKNTGMNYIFRFFHTNFQNVSCIPLLTLWSEVKYYMGIIIKLQRKLEFSLDVLWIFWWDVEYSWTGSTMAVCWMMFDKISSHYHTIQT